MMEEEQIATMPIRLYEVMLVLAVAFAGSLVMALAITSGQMSLKQKYSQGPWEPLFFNFSELISLAVLAYVLSRSGRTLGQLAGKFRLSDIPAAMVLAIVSYIACITLFYGMWFAGFQSTFTSKVARESMTMLSSGVTIGPLLAVVINPIFEELIVRAYLMNEVMAATKKPWVAIVVSTVFQSSYHLYQGPVSAIMLGGGFLVSSIYYAKTGRIIPVIIAHFLFDFYALVNMSVLHQ